MSQRVVKGFSLLGLALGAYFLFMGIEGIVSYNSGSNQILEGINNLLGTSGSGVINLVISILQVVSGVFLVLGTFGIVGIKLHNMAHWIVVGLWLAYLVWKFIVGYNFKSGITLSWLTSIAHGLVILFALFSTKKIGN